MEVTYLAYSPNGDIPLEPDDLAEPFRISPHETHPFLTLGNYLDVVRDFVLDNDGRGLFNLMESRGGGRISPRDPGSLRICTRKHGVLYHVASVEARIGGERCKLCASTAISEKAGRWLSREVEVLQELHRKFGLPYLPVPLRFGKASCQCGGYNAFLSVLLVDWFEGFHEWHLVPVEPGGPPAVHIWDHAHGYRLATKREAESLFRESARILTRYYDLEGRRQILAWHHAAGDFVVRPGNSSSAVRLTTARRYGPLPGLGPEDGPHAAVALTCFFLNLALRMRLDKEDGLGQMQWAGEDALQGTVNGFFAGLAEQRRSGTPILEKDIEVLDLFRSFSSNELLTLHEPILQQFSKDLEEEALALVEDRLEDHVRELHRTLQGVRGRGFQAGW